MSQNILNYVKNGTPMTLVAGYDRPLGQLYATVNPTDMSSEEADFGDGSPEELMFADFGSAQDIQEALKPFDIAMPKDMVRAIDEDKLLHTGNRIRKFALDGTVLEDIVL